MIVSIDIGTSYSSICRLGPDGKVQPVDISTGAGMFGSKYSLPSAVFVEDGGNILVGQAALNNRRRRPENCRMEFKRNLGEDAPVLLGERSFHTEDLYTELFRHMKAKAQSVTDEPVGRTFLTYPASYGKDRRERLCSAAKAAGLFDLQLVDEPTAAAMCYCAQGYVKDGQTLLVYDFGGGTFDTALIRYENGRFTHLAQPTGLERCGGMDIDYLIMQDMRRAIEKEYPGTWDGLKGNKERYMRFTVRLNEMAVKAKHHLSDAGLYDDYIEVAGADEVFYRLTREQLNQMTASLVGQTVSVCRQMLADAGMSASGLSAVLLVGGTSRIPLVQEMAGKIMGKPPLCAADLELSVAQGPLMYLHKQEEIEQEQKKRQEAEERHLQQEREKRKMQQKAKELEEKLKKEREEAAAREKARREAEDRERRKRELEAAEKSRREAEERERQREAAGQKKEDEDLVLGRYAEEFISSYPYVKKGERDFEETYVAMFRAQVNMPVQEKVLLAANVLETNTYKGKAIQGTVFTNRGIYHRERVKDEVYGWVIKDHFTGWKKFAVSKLDISAPNHVDIMDVAAVSVIGIALNVYGHLLIRVHISGEEVARIYFYRASAKVKKAMQYEFFLALQQYLLSKM